MATLVLNTVGTALGGPIGGALGALVGQTIDQQLFGSDRRRGPRLGDLSVQTSSYGSPIPRIYGTVRVAGTVVWATDLKEEETGSGGGKSGPEQVSYRYSANLAVALSSRPIQSVKRIWADGKLIRGVVGDFKVKTGFRLHLGDEDQPIDPLIASVETLAGTPAYRGLALAVFEGLELAEFGNRIPMLTFEVVAEDEAIPIAELLRDASGGIIQSGDTRRIPGFAAHGSSIGDSLSGFIDLAGVALTEQDGRLKSPPARPPVLLRGEEIGCDPDGEMRPRVERVRASEAELPAALSMTYYDPDRDYQAGQARAFGGASGKRDERIELPAVLSAAQAKGLVEEAFARRWRSADRLKLRLPPSRMDLRPGMAVQLAGTAQAWVVRTVSIEGMAAAIEADAAPITVAALPADGGRPVSEPDLPVGRTDLALFELPAMGETPDNSIKIHIAASSAGMWKSVPVELAAAVGPLAGITTSRRAILGTAQTALDGRAPLVLDEISAVVIQLSNPAHYLLNADHDALMAGANLTIVGDELIQFGKAEQLGAGLYRLSALLRGRRGTEWAASTHMVGDRFCLVDAIAMRTIDFAASIAGTGVTATAHGVGDTAPLPAAQRTMTGENLRPPSPCHLKLRRAGANLVMEWVRRSHRGWIWSDDVGVADDPFPQRYRINATGPAGQLVTEVGETSANLNVADLPGQAGQQIMLAVSTVGPLALSRAAVATIIL